MTKIFNRKVGAAGEEIAADYLRKKGFRIREMNYATKWGELDLIATKDDVLVFVEVKLKSSGDFGTPEEMIGPKKLAQVGRTAERYLLDNPDMAEKYGSYRIDAVCIIQNERINHYENLTF